MKKHQRSFGSLLTASSLLVLAVTRILAFVRPFSIRVVGLHALIGFVFVGLIALRVANNLKPLSRYLQSKVLWLMLEIAAGLCGLFLWQTARIRSIAARFPFSSEGFKLKELADIVLPVSHDHSKKIVFIEQKNKKIAYFAKQQ